MTTNVLSNQEKCRGAAGVEKCPSCHIVYCRYLEAVFVFTLVEANIHGRKSQSIRLTDEIMILNR